MVLDGHGVVRLMGELDIETTPSIRHAVRKSLDNHPTLLRVDLAEASFCDCSALRALLWAKDEASRTGARFHVSGPLQPPVARLLAVTGAGVELGVMPDRSV
ncbi:STAS domain-containing protein [Streptomyces sp. NPDC101733]|uniref:STAS domain-containing protein n=1 Tax=unclassified Streptomyces TaxID=2593676 RepID=UPI00382BA988